MIYNNFLPLRFSQWLWEKIVILVIKMIYIIPILFSQRIIGKTAIVASVGTKGVKKFSRIRELFLQCNRSLNLLK